MKISNTTWVISVFCAVKLGLHLLADYHSGFQGDELLHIQTGDHLASGYMEFPPLIGLLAWIQDLSHSDSVFVHHIFAHLACIGIIMLVARTILLLGGDARAVFTGLMCILIAPGFERSQQLFQPVVFSQFWWVLNFYYLLKYILRLEKKYLWYLTFTLIAAFLTKYDAVFFAAGLPVLLFSRRTRTALIQHQFWKCLLVFLLAISPNLIWQYANDFPVFQMFSRLYSTQLDHLSFIEELRSLILSTNPLAWLVIIAGFIYLGIKSPRNIYFLVLCCITVSIVYMIYSKGKQYYFYPIILTIIPFGAIFYQEIIFAWRKWSFYPLAIILCLGLVMIPFGMPVYSLDRYIDRIHKKYADNTVPGGKYAISFEEYYSQFMWPQVLTLLGKTYETLSPAQKQHCLVWGRHYRQAGAVALWGKQYGLPAVFSYHGSFYSWAPLGNMPATILVLDYNGSWEEDYKELFTKITKVGRVYNPYADEEETLFQYVYICEGPLQSFDDMKRIYKDRIYE
ncbi:hypothetical protein COR50_17730 [Chitinophaga caeni]|uniref:Rhodanese domain-containing protein n=1 Tax=Chitinophaga caeni TaxID=2029983 RepID=A0A291QY11_9BACT|nr:glycosyltransferase family 39 protein [Chitinophaga caeni]ATL48856.1 hypothetical protein COR50_17730 [Chitinophaga caeni]